MGACCRLACCSLVLFTGCVWRTAPPIPQLPSDSSVVREQLVVYSDFKLPKHHRLLDELVAQRSDISGKLDLPVSDEPIYIYLFDTPEHYQAYIGQQHPEFPRRRAFFVESDTRLAVYAYWGDRVAEDLRHEVAHGYLHAVVRNLPLWLDEGLAEYFEVARGRQGMNQPHRDLLLQQYQAGQWLPNLEFLEQIASSSEMSQRDYAESWLWVHMMLESQPARRAMLQNYLARLRVTGASPPLSAFLRKEEPHAERSLLMHLQAIGHPAQRAADRRSERLP